MPMQALALVRVPYVDVCAAHDKTPAATLEAARASTAPFLPLGADGTACLLETPFGDEPDAFLDELFDVFGDVLAGHDDERGVLIAPEPAWKQGLPDGYEAAVAHVGEAGEWVALPEVDDDAMGEFGDLQGVMSQMQGILGGNPMLAQQAQAAAQGMMSGGQPDVAAMMNNPNLMAVAQQMMARMSPEQMAQLEQMASAMFGGAMPPGITAPGTPSQPPRPVINAPKKK